MHYCSIRVTTVLSLPLTYQGVWLSWYSQTNKWYGHLGQVNRFLVNLFWSHRYISTESIAMHCCSLFILMMITPGFVFICFLMNHSKGFWLLWHLNMLLNKNYWYGKGTPWYAWKRVKRKTKHRWHTLIGALKGIPHLKWWLCAASFGLWICGCGQ